MSAGSSNEVSIGKALCFDALKKNSESPAGLVRYLGFADDGDMTLERVMQSLSVKEPTRLRE